MALSTDKKNIIYVKIINEPVPAWEPVNAILIKDNIYRIIDDNDSYHSIYNKWEFSPNSLVKCELKELIGIENKKNAYLVAIELINE